MVAGLTKSSTPVAWAWGHAVQSPRGQDSLPECVWAGGERSPSLHTHPLAGDRRRSSG